MTDKPYSPKTSLATPSWARRRTIRELDDAEANKALRILDELTEIGMEQAQALLERVQARAATGQPLTAPGDEDVGAEFERIARGVCGAITLSARISRRMDSIPARPAQRPTPAPTPPLVVAAPGAKRTVH